MRQINVQIRIFTLKDLWLILNKPMEPFYVRLIDLNAASDFAANKEYKVQAYLDDRGEIAFKKEYSSESLPVANLKKGYGYAKHNPTIFVKLKTSVKKKAA